MRGSILSICVLSFVICSSLLVQTSAVEIYTGTSDSLNDLITHDAYTLVLFYEPVPKIQQLKMLFKRAAEEVMSSDIDFVQVDVEENHKILLKHEFEKFPTIRLYKDGKKLTDVKGEVNIKTLAAFINKYLEDSTVRKWTKEEELKNHINALSKDVQIPTVVGFFNEESKEEKSIYQQVAGSYIGQFEFHEITAKSFKSLGVKNIPSVGVYRNFGVPQFYPYDTSISQEKESGSTLEVAHKFDKKDLTEWLRVVGVNLVEEVTRENMKTQVSKRRLPLVILWLDYNAPTFDKYMEDFRRVSIPHRTELAFLYSNGNEYQAQMKQFGLSGSLPAITILDTKKYLHYAYENQPINTNTISEFAKGYLQNSITPIIKKETPPATNDEPVKTVVYDTFNSLVIESKTDVLLAFYEPNNKNSQLLLPMLEKIALNDAVKDNLVVAKMNSKLNDTPRHGIHSVITSYPTIKYFSSVYKVPSVYTDSMITVEKLLQWVAKEKEESMKKAAEIKIRLRDAMKDEDKSNTNKQENAEEKEKQKDEL